MTVNPAGNLRHPSVSGSALRQAVDKYMRLDDWRHSGLDINEGGVPTQELWIAIRPDAEGAMTSDGRPRLTPIMPSE